MNYYCIKQHDITDCGAACLATVSKQYGLQTSITKIREIAGTDKMGTNAYGMVKAAEHLGFTAKAVKGTQEAFFTDFPLPCIAHVAIGGTLLHYVVIHKISKKEVIIADPAKGIVKKSPEEFFKEWTGVFILLVPSAKFVKRKETKNIFERFFYLLIPQKKLIFDIFLESVIITVFGIFGAFYFQIIVDDILPSGIKKTLCVVSIGAIMLKIFSVIMLFLRNQFLAYLSQKLDIALLLGYYEHVLKLPMSFFGSRRIGEIISRFQDASSIRDAISNATLTIMIDTLLAIVGGLILFFKSKVLFAIALLMIMLYVLLVCLFNKPYKKSNEKYMEDNALLTSYLVESLNGIQTIKAFNGENTVQNETEFRFVRSLKSVFKLLKLNNIQDGLKLFIEYVGEIVILWVGTNNVLNGKMTVGDLISFNALLVYFLEPIKNLINLQPTLQTAFVASDRLGEILDLPIEKGENEQNKIEPENLEGDIDIRNISFRYGTREYILKDFSLKIKAGQKIAIVGESGAGKSTLAKLLLNLYPYENGSITIANNMLPDIKLDTLREKIAYVPQETFLFSGTIMENLLFGIKERNIDEVFRCAKIAQIHDTINAFPLRYETHLDENGSNLSGGQRQRIAIARALLKKPNILILDESTSNLDAVTEKAIQEAINEFSERMTTIIIAHRLSTIKRCDCIFVMEKGKIIEFGTHQELINDKSGYYRNLYYAQIGENE